MDIYKELCRIVKQDNVLTDELMCNHTTFRIGGKADYYVSPDSENEVASLIRFCETNKIRYHIHGNGSNVLFNDNGYRGVIICIGSNLSEIAQNDNIIKAQSGVLLAGLSVYAASKGLSGLEFASGIPGTLGGAVTMNAGAYGGEMKDVIESVTVCDREGNVRVLNKDELCLGYRTSIIQKNELTVLSATLKLTEGDSDRIKAGMKELNNKRREKQPLEYGSAGSTFKRPEGYFAGKLIEDSGLKGYRVGDAMVSEKHAGFVVNVGNATAEDVKTVMTHVQEEVKKRYDVWLEPEVRIIQEG
ncbi:MAG: UDP-N-acetylmuramate dehydrogenase [Lachnospiraceae bacterium]|nr:UDP-N-acetylmuramate dehydrogenase [Lachnospiraceae bacterium]